MSLKFVSVSMALMASPSLTSFPPQHGQAAGAAELFLALRALTARAGPSALVAASFALHPLRVESVAWVAQRKDVLAGLLFALTRALFDLCLARLAPSQVGRCRVFGRRDGAPDLRHRDEAHRIADEDAVVARVVEELRVVGRLVGEEGGGLTADGGLLECPEAICLHLRGDRASRVQVYGPMIAAFIGRAGAD